MEPITAQMPDTTLVVLYVVIAVFLIKFLFTDPYENIG